MSSDLESEIQAWLSKQGFPLEMEAAYHANIKEFSVSQSDYFIDPETKESREIDLVLTIDRHDGTSSLSYKLLVECKSSPDKPWLQFAGHNDIPPNLSHSSLVDRVKFHGAFVGNKPGLDLALRAVNMQEAKSIPARERSAATRLRAYAVAH